MAEKEIKAWYDDIDGATLQRIKSYSVFNDYDSKNLMMQAMYEYKEKEIQDFKETNHGLALESIAKGKRIKELEKENAELKEKIKDLKSRSFSDFRLYNGALDIAIQESVMSNKQQYKEYLLDKAKFQLSRS